MYHAFMKASDIISLWPSAEIFAQDIGLKYRSHGRVMKLRNRIPRGHWDAVIKAARSRDIDGVDLLTLERAHNLEAAQ